MPETPLSPTNAKELTGDKAIEMAEVAIILNDLNACTLTCNIILQRYMTEPLNDEDRHIKLALFRDAVNLYVAAFSRKNTQHPLDPDEVYPDASNGFRQFFDWAKELRNSYAAHTFGPMRQCVTIAYADPITGVGMGVGRFWADTDPVSLDAVTGLASVAAAAARFAGGKGQSLETELLAEVQRMSAEEMAALPVCQIHMPAPEDYRTDRHKFRRIKTGQAAPPKRPRRKPPKA